MAAESFILGAGGEGLSIMYINLCLKIETVLFGITLHSFFGHYHYAAADCSLIAHHAAADIGVLSLLGSVRVYIDYLRSSYPRSDLGSMYVCV